MAIHRPERREPILRREIAVFAERVADRASKEERMLEFLQDLDPASSRAVVFVTSRRLAEELATTVSLKAGVAAAPFHARLSAEVRLETYEQFREGTLTVLCATKAFGMGMDIDNIHLVVHFGPPSSLEDYIQEIGRAARDRFSLRKAGLEQARAYLLYEPGDFPRMQDRLKSSFLSSIDLVELHSMLVQEWQRAGSSVDQILTLRPGHLAGRLRGGECTSNQVRTGLYWLDRLGRVRIGFYTPSQIEVEVDLDQARAARRSLSEETKHLVDFLQKNIEAETRQTVVFFAARDAVHSLNLSTQNHLFSLIAELARRKVVRYRRKLLLPLAQRRAQEARIGASDGSWPLLQAVSAAIQRIRQDLEFPGLHGLVYKGQDLADQFAAIASDHFEAEGFAWLDPVEREEQARREQQSFPQRVPAVLRLLRGLQIVRARQQVSDEGLTLYLTQGRQDWDLWLEALPALIKASLRNIVSQEQARGSSESEEEGEIDAQELLLSVEEAARDSEIVLGISHLQAILRFLRDLGYLRRSDVFVPMALEVQVIDPDPIDLADGSQDAKILSDFEDQKRLRMLRLAALQAVPDLASDPGKLQGFVEQRYFRAASSEELMAILEENLPADNEILAQLREEALRELLDGNEAEGKPGLSSQQREVYDAPLDRHLLVVAGPGAGKTHTLLARLVRLVHTEDVRAGDILVLAFTRAVVSELRYRVQSLLSRLGYGSLARDICVTTFHSFVLRTLREFNLADDDLRLDDTDWFELFEQRLRTNRALRRSVEARYRYVFVDEFQDVHGARYRLLEYLSSGRQTYLMVVGDDDQSIYDYERATGEESAVQYFLEYKKRFNAARYDLTVNYRSLKTIVDFSQDVIAALPDRMKRDQSLEAYRTTKGVAEWRQTPTSPVTLVEDAQRALSRLADQGPQQGTGGIAERLRTRLSRTPQKRQSQDGTVAVLARTNADVYRVKAQLQAGLGDRFSFLVQGEESRFIDRRDVATVIELLQQSIQDEQLTPTRLQQALLELLSRSQIQYWLHNQPYEHHELWYLAQEFLAGAGYQASLLDFTDYVREMSRNGNYLRVVARRQLAADGRGRILLSTVHKVKGIEFPAVILLTSDMRVGADEAGQELRVMYVGMTRAKDVLVAVQGEREKRLLEQQAYEPTDDRQNDLAVAPSLGDVFISKFGYEWDNQQYIRDKVRRGDGITLVRNQGQRNPFSIKHSPSGRYIGLLSGRFARSSSLTRQLLQRFGDARQLMGLEVTGVYRRYVHQDKHHDEEHGTLFYERLCGEVKEAGYYYVTEIGGLVKPG